ncbi:MAG TPA: serine hydrolase [Thermoleophilia bacterium]|nr:serine hydrolase [Thermoleophilia bacterium]
MRPRWRAGVLAAAGAATLLAGCGIRVAAGPSPSTAPARTATLVASAPASPSAAPSPQVAPPQDVPSAVPTAAPSAAPAPALSGRRAAKLAAAARRVSAAAAVRRALPALDPLVASMVARSGVPGAAVAVVAGDTVMYSRSFGLREMGRPDPVDDDTLFQLGAVSRAYTSTMLAALAGEGELGWDQPVRRAWPGFRLRDPWATREATFRDLTAGRSGMPAHAGDELLAFGYGRAEVLRRLRQLRPAAGFRAEFAPQDGMVTAAAAAAERATGRSWARLVRERVLEPVGDHGTVLTWRGFLRAVDKATPHRLVAGTMVPQDPADESVFAPSLGVSASLSGLVTFARLQLNGGAVAGARVAPAGLLAQTLRPATAVADTPSGPEAAAPGWMLSTFDGRLLASAEGGLASGSSATVTLLPDDGVAVIVLANAYPEGAALGGAIARTLTDLAVLGAPQEDWLAREQAALATERASVPAAGLALPPQAPAAAPAPRARDVYAGVYENRYYGRVTVRPDAGDGLVVRLGRGQTLRYAPWSADIWRDMASGTAAVFAVRGGRAQAVTLTQLTFDGRRGAFARVD